MHAKEWTSWEEFLGAMRPYQEAKEMVKSLELKSMEDHIAFVIEDVKRAESLRIAAKTEIVYRNKGWKGAEAFFKQSQCPWHIFSGFSSLCLFISNKY